MINHYYYYYDYYLVVLFNFNNFVVQLSNLNSTKKKKS